MIYVYIKNGGIIRKSKDVVNGINYDEVQQVEYNINDRLIYEKGKVVKYRESNQYKKDYFIEGVEEERDRLKKELNESEAKYDKLSCDYLRLRTQYDLLKKRNIN